MDHFTVASRLSSGVVLDQVGASGGWPEPERTFRSHAEHRASPQWSRRIPSTSEASFLDHADGGTRCSLRLASASHLVETHALQERPASATKPLNARGRADTVPSACLWKHRNPDRARAVCDHAERDQSERSIGSPTASAITKGRPLPLRPGLERGSPKTGAPLVGIGSSSKPPSCIRIGDLPRRSAADPSPRGGAARSCRRTPEHRGGVSSIQQTLNDARADRFGVAELRAGFPSRMSAGASKAGVGAPVSWSLARDAAQPTSGRTTSGE